MYICVEPGVGRLVRNDESESDAPTFQRKATEFRQGIYILSTTNGQSFPKNEMSLEIN